MGEQVTLWLLIRDWLREKDNGWSVGTHGETHLIESEYCKFYIGPDYVAGYPSCGENLQAVDPEFFEKLEERFDHVITCARCKFIVEMDKLSIEEMFKSFGYGHDDTDIKPVDDSLQLLKALNSCYRTMGKPLPYPTIKIDP